MGIEENKKVKGLAFASEAKFSEWLRKEEFPSIPKSFWYKPSTVAKRGVPDWFGCVNGFFVALELKTSHARPDPAREKLQRYTCDKIMDAGCRVVYARVTPDSWKKVKKEILSLLEVRVFQVVEKNLPVAASPRKYSGNAKKNKASE
jgi:hypothetical protein